MLVLVLFVSLLAKSDAKFYNDTANTTDLTRCRVHYSRSESFYKEFYEVADEAHSNTTILDFHFSVLAPSDAHILFSTKTKVEKTDPAYEIVLGAGGNMFSDIRRQQKSLVKASVRLRNLLNSLDPQSFWIHISKDGLIEVGRAGEELAFISWKDSEPLPIKYFSFGTWPGVEAKWYFDCPREDNSTGHSKEVERPLTHVERLRLDVLSFYDPYVRPVMDPLDITTVKMKMITNYIFLDEYKSALSVKGQLMLSWLDEKLKWNPNDYGNVTLLHIVGREIWQPDLAVFNAVDIIGRDFLDQTIMTATHQGVIEWNPSAHIDVWCDASELGHWPNDVHDCDILLGFATNTVNNLQIKFINESQIIGNLFNTEWNVLETQVTDITNYRKLWLSDNYDLSLVRISFKIQRSSKIYNAVFFTPFAAIAIAMLSTFWVSPSGYLKISLGCLQLVLTSLVMVNLAGYIPAHPNKVPYLINLYSYSFIGSLMSIVIAILVVNLSRSQYETNMPFRVWTVLTSRLLQRALLLPKFTKSENYGKLDEGETSLKPDSHDTKSWAVLGIIIDRVSFVVYFILILYAIIAKY